MTDSLTGQLLDGDKTTLEGHGSWAGICTNVTDTVCIETNDLLEPN